MMKKFFTFIFLFFSIFSFVNASNETVEEVFRDVDKNYKYYNELQSLYDRGIILPDEKWNFNPKANLTRDEFVWIVSEISCKSCIKPNVDLDLFEKYSNKEVFFDISKNDKFFYCIADAVANEQVTGYQEWTSCQNWVSKAGEKPFCPQNNILLEEALAIVLRTSNILTLKEAENMRKDILAGKKFQNLWKISPLLSNWSVYSFYPDFKKAYDFSFLDYDKNWVWKTLKLLDFTGNVDPKAYLTREDFLRISYIVLKNNSCSLKTKNDFWLKIETFDKSCSAEKKDCKVADFWPGEKIFDFRWKILNFEDKDYTYTWRFYSYKTWWDTIKTGKFIDNHNFLAPWKYRVYLTAKNKEGWKSEVFTDIKITWWETTTQKENWLESKIIVDKPIPNIWEKINFIWITNGIDVTYSWDFWDGKKWNGKNIDHKYEKDWNYIVTLTVRDKEGNISKTTREISVWKWQNPNDWFTSYIEVDKITTTSWYNINFEWFTNKWGDVTYNWDFWDGKTWTWKNISHNFWSNWVYTVTLVTTDPSSNTSTSTVNIKISDSPWFEWKIEDSDWDWVPDNQDYEKNTPKDKIKFICTFDMVEKWLYTCKETDLWVYKPQVKNNIWDSDWDGIPDNTDRCPEIKWKAENFWCPIFEKTCKVDANCTDWGFCDNWYCRPKNYSPNCAYSWWHIITWDLKCTSCPCEYELDYRAKLRACDIVFPAIISPDQKDIFSKWKYFQIKK